VCRAARALQSTLTKRSGAPALPQLVLSGSSVGPSARSDQDPQTLGRWWGDLQVADTHAGSGEAGSKACEPGVKVVFAHDRGSAGDA
jgi:hypothetical protein